MADADELFADAEYCRQLAGEADPLTRRILLELVEQYENEGHLLLAYPPPSSSEVSTARQTKTAIELEHMILSRVRDEKTACPADLQIRVVRVGNRWDAFAEVIDNAKYPDCLARVVTISSEFRERYDLAA